MRERVSLLEQQRGRPLGGVGAVGVMQHSKVQITSSPLPPPEDLQRYAQIDPTLVNRLFTFAETQMSHRHEVERTIVRGRLRSAMFSTTCGAIVALAGMGMGVFLVIAGHPKEAALCIGTPLALMVGALVTGRLWKRKPGAEEQQQ